MNSKLTLIMCSFVPVGLEDYVDYFKKHFEHFIYIKLKFPHSKASIKSLKEIYSKGNLKEQNDLYSIPMVSNKTAYFMLLPIFYGINFLSVIFSIWKSDKSTKRIFFGINYFTTLCGIILKKMGKIDYVIYRVMDFFPIPKKGIYRYLNRIFFVIDRFCLKNSDYVWFTTEGHIAGREKYGYYDRKKEKYKLIPLGVNLDKIYTLPITKENIHSLVYCGNVSRYHMVDLIFDVVTQMKKKYSDVKLSIVGTGPDEEYFKKLAKEMDIERNVIFNGFLPEGDTFNKIMADNALGFALYKDEEDFMKYTEPAKVKYYLSFGVPAIISKVPKLAEELDKKRVSIAVSNNAKDILEKIYMLLDNEKLLQEYKHNISNYLKEIDINKLLSDTINSTFSEWGITYER